MARPIRRLGKFFAEEHTLITPKVEAKVGEWLRQPVTRAQLLWFWLVVLAMWFHRH